MTEKGMDITTWYVTSISTSLPGGADFPGYTHQWMAGHLDAYMKGALSSPPYSVPGDVLDYYSIPQRFRNAFMAHFAGDESITPDEQTLVTGLGQISPELSGIVTAVWTDLTPSDNQLHINLPNK